MLSSSPLADPPIKQEAAYSFIIPDQIALEPISVEDARQVLMDLKSSLNPCETFSSLIQLRSIIKSHSDEFLSHSLPGIVGFINDELKSLRSAIARHSAVCAIELSRKAGASLSKSAESDSLIASLMTQACSEKKFIRDEANQALTILSEVTPSTVSLFQSFLRHSASRNRRMTELSGEFANSSFSRLSSESIAAVDLNGIAPSVANLYSSKSSDARRFGEDISFKISMSRGAADWSNAVRSTCSRSDVFLILEKQQSTDISLKPRLDVDSIPGVISPTRRSSRLEIGRVARTETKTRVPMGGIRALLSNRSPNSRKRLFGAISRDDSSLKDPVLPDTVSVNGCPQSSPAASLVATSSPTLPDKTGEDISHTASPTTICSSSNIPTSVSQIDSVVGSCFKVSGTPKCLSINSSDMKTLNFMESTRDSPRSSTEQESIVDSINTNRKKRRISAAEPIPTPELFFSPLQVQEIPLSREPRSVSIQDNSSEGLSKDAPVDPTVSTLSFSSPSAPAEVDLSQSAPLHSKGFQSSEDFKLEDITLSHSPSMTSSSSRVKRDSVRKSVESPVLATDSPLSVADTPKSKKARHADIDVVEDIQATSDIASVSSNINVSRLSFDLQGS